MTAKALETALDAPILTLAKKNWSGFTTVGDQSDHITQIGTILTSLMPSVQLPPKYFKSLCDKFAEGFLNKILNAIITRCKPMSEVGAEQMLLDIHSLNTILQTISNHATFTKILGRGISAIDKLLKIVMRLHEPPEGIVDTYILLYGDDVSSSFLVKILELKGLKRGEINVVLECFGRKGGLVKTPEVNRFQGFRFMK